MLMHYYIMNFLFYPLLLCGLKLLLLGVGCCPVTLSWLNLTFKRGLTLRFLHCLNKTRPWWRFIQSDGEPTYKQLAAEP